MIHPDPTTDPAFELLWRTHRRRMLQIALRMLSDLGDADDVVQEVFGRLARTGLDTVDDPEGWLVVVTSRLCLDVLRARHRHPTVPLMAAIDAADPQASDPADHVALVDSITMSMHVVLERLSPAERTSFVLHDVFQLPFDEIAVIVGRNPDACRQLASRARRTVRDHAADHRFAVEDNVHTAVAERFIVACTSGDLTGLLAVLDPMVDGTADVAGTELTGANLVGPGILRYLGPTIAPTLLHLPIGDRIGVVAMHHRRVLALVLLTIHRGLVVHVEALTGDEPRAAVSRSLGLGL